MGFISKLLKTKQADSDNYRELPEKRILRYKVKGTNPLTGRRKTVKNVVIASWHQYPDNITGINGPYEFILDMPILSDRQKNVFRQNGVKIPKGLSRDDASVVISHIICTSDGNPLPYFPAPLPDEMMEEAALKKLFMPSFLTISEAKKFLRGKEWRSDL